MARSGGSTPRRSAGGASTAVRSPSQSKVSAGGKATPKSRKKQPSSNGHARQAPAEDSDGELAADEGGAAATDPEEVDAEEDDVAAEDQDLEVLPKDPDFGAFELPSEARLAAVAADTPELLTLLQDLQESLAEVRRRVGPLLAEVRSGELGTTQGISYLEAKHLLLLSYVINIVFYLLLKAEGRPVRDHPVIARLVEVRAYMEKVRPIDKQLHYQIEKLLKAAEHARTADAAVMGGEEEEGQDEGRKAAGARAGTRGARGGDADEEEDVLRYGPKPDQLVTKLDLAMKAAGPDADGKVGIYKPPRLNPTAMDNGEGGGLSKQEQRKLDHTKRRSARSDLVRELAAELAGAPEETRYEMPGVDSMTAIRQRQKQDARASEEEDLMIRVPLTKEEAKRQRIHQRQAMSGGGVLGDDFADEVADIVDASKGIEDGGKLADLFARQQKPRSKAQAGSDERKQQQQQQQERRSVFDGISAGRAAASAREAGSDDDDNDDQPQGGPRGGGGGGGGGKGRRGSGDDFGDVHRRSGPGSARGGRKSPGSSQKRGQPQRSSDGARKKNRS